MKILYDYTAFILQEHGGVSRVLYEVMNRISALPDVDGRVFCGIHCSQYLVNLPENSSLKVVGWHIPKRFLKQRIVLFLNRILFWFYAQWFRPDICHYTYFQTPPVPRSCKTLITVHDMIHELFPNAFHHRDRQAKWKKKAVCHVDGIICVSENTRDDLKKIYDIGGDKVVVIPHGNSLVGISPASVELKDSYLLYVGTRSITYKNFDVVLRAMSKLEKFHLVCFGGGKFSESERSRIEKMGLDGRVHQVGGDDAVLAGYYAKAFALIYPSIYEGFGLPPVEAMGLGCPVISSNAPPMPEVVSSAGLFFDPTSEKMLTQRIMELTDDVVRNNLILAGEKRAETFSWEKAAGAVYAFYCDLLKDMS